MLVPSIRFAPGGTLLRFRVFTMHRQIRNLHTKDYSCVDVAVFLLVHRDRTRLEKLERDDSKMPASEIVKLGRDSG